MITDVELPNRFNRLNNNAFAQSLNVSPVRIRTGVCSLKHRPWELDVSYGGAVFSETFLLPGRLCIGTSLSTKSAS